MNKQLHTKTPANDNNLLHGNEPIAKLARLIKSNYHNEKAITDEQALQGAKNLIGLTKTCIEIHQKGD